MRIAVIVITAVPLPVIALLLAMLRRCRRAGRPDRAAEWYVAAWAVFSLSRLVTAIWWTHTTTSWLWWTVQAPLILGGFALLCVRIRRNPDVLFSPATVARARRLAAKIRRNR